MQSDILKSLKSREAKLLQQLEVVRDMIDEELRKNGSPRPEPASVQIIDDTVDLGKTTNEKFLNVLKRNQRFMKVREIAREIVDIHGGTEDDWSIKLSRRTRKLKELGKIEKHQVGKSKTNVFWGSPNWLDENNMIKHEYQYHRNALNEGRSSNLDEFEL